MSEFDTLQDEIIAGRDAFFSEFGVHIIIIFCLLFLALFVWLTSPLGKADGTREKDLGYRKRWSFMNKSEASFFQILSRELNSEFYIFPKTRIADIIKTVDGDGYYARRNRVLPKHIDFLICSKNFEPLMAIEVDGSSHDSLNRRERDGEVDAIFNSVEIPLRHVRVGTDFVTECKEIYLQLK